MPQMALYAGNIGSKPGSPCLCGICISATSSSQMAQWYKNLPTNAGGMGDEGLVP